MFYQRVLLTKYEEFRNFALTANSPYLQTAALTNITSGQHTLSASAVKEFQDAA